MCYLGSLFTWLRTINFTRPKIPIQSWIPSPTQWDPQSEFLPRTHFALQAFTYRFHGRASLHSSSEWGAPCLWRAGGLSRAGTHLNLMAKQSPQGMRPAHPLGWVWKTVSACPMMSWQHCAVWLLWHFVIKVVHDHRWAFPDGSPCVLSSWSSRMALAIRE